jgi:hypothetical protein
MECKNTDYTNLQRWEKNYINEIICYCILYNLSENFVARSIIYREDVVEQTVTSDICYKDGGRFLLIFCAEMCYIHDFNEWCMEKIIQ